MLPLWWFSWLEMLVLDQDKDCVSYIREENELVLALVCFFLSLLVLEKSLYIVSNLKARAPSEYKYMNACNIIFV